MAKSKWFDKKWLVVLVYTNIQMYRYTCSGADPGFLLGGGALVSCSTSTPINHINHMHTPCTLPLDLPLILIKYSV